MSDIMKLGYIAALVISVGVFNSCSGAFMHKKAPEQPVVYYSVPHINTAYGSYLAARVAHLRQDLNVAADYYIKSIELGANKPEIVGQTYVLLTSEGRIGEAAKYAKESLKQGDKSNFIYFVIMTDELQKNNYKQALSALESIHDKVYKKSIIPLFSAWIYAAEGDKNQALKQLSTLKKDKSLLSLYYMHNGMINDYFNDATAAKAAFDTVVKDENLELSYRSMQIISNFYIRSGHKDEAVALVKKYYDKNPQAKMMESLYKQVLNTDTAGIAEIIDTPQKGEGEAIFNVGTVFRGYQADISQVFTALALYLNPQHDVALVSMADLLENNQRYAEAIKKYEQISPQSPIYFMGQMKIAGIYMEKHLYDAGLNKLKALQKQYPDNYQVLFNLGEINRITNHQEKAVDFYKKAIKAHPQAAKSDWTIYYALGMAYEQSGDWDNAEKALQTALKISRRHPFVLNYLGYSWLEHNKNINEALFMIFEAYRQNPEDGHIMDSLGWALYRMGKFNDAIKILERAAEYLPANAIICDHLGDAYWQVGRKAEAKFQWQHALSLKEDSENLNKEAIKLKISDGVNTPVMINFNEPLLIERIKTLNLTE